MKITKMTEIIESTTLYKISEDYTKRESIKILKRILDYIENIKPDWKEPKIFIDEGMNPTHSKFEKLSRLCRIGVISRTKKGAYVLLFLLRIIMDKCGDLLMGFLCHQFGERIVQIGSIVDYLSRLDILKHTKMYKIKGTIGSGSNKNTLDEIDLWNINRIRKNVC